MRDAGGTLTADAASKAGHAATGEVDGGTVHGVRALSDGTYRGRRLEERRHQVHVLLDATFAVTSVEEGGMGRGSGRPRDPTETGCRPPWARTAERRSTGSTDPSTRTARARRADDTGASSTTNRGAGPPSARGGAHPV